MQTHLLKGVSLPGLASWIVLHVAPETGVLPVRLLNKLQMEKREKVDELEYLPLLFFPESCISSYEITFTQVVEHFGQHSTVIHFHRLKNFFSFHSVPFRRQQFHNRTIHLRILEQ